MLSVSGIVTTDEEILHAIEHIENDDFQVALPILSRAVAFQPNNALAYQLWIMCHIHLGRLEKAFRSLRVFFEGHLIIGVGSQTPSNRVNMPRRLTERALDRRAPRRAAVPGAPRATRRVHREQGIPWGRRETQIPHRLTAGGALDKASRT